MSPGCGLSAADHSKINAWVRVATCCLKHFVKVERRIKLSWAGPDAEDIINRALNLVQMGLMGMIEEVAPLLWPDLLRALQNLVYLERACRKKRVSGDMLCPQGLARIEEILSDVLLQAYLSPPFG